MKSNIKMLLCLLLAACMILSLAACGAEAPKAEAPAAQDAEAASAAEAPALETMGDAFAYESLGNGSGDTLFVYVFEKDGVYWRAMAEIPADVSEALWDLDFFADDYDEQHDALLAPLEIISLENLSERIPPQEELDALIGTTGAALKEDGWSIWSWNLDTLEFGMYHGPFQYTVVMEGDFVPNENYDFDEDEDFAPLTVKSVAFDGIGDAVGEALDAAMADEDFDVWFDEDFEEGSDEGSGESAGIDYLALVNKLNPLPDGWEDALETVTIVNSVGQEVEAEAKAYDAYERLKDDLAVNNAIYLELDSGRRSVAEQEEIMEHYIEKYGADYAAKTVAQPGYSEHHTGLALDLYFRVQNDNGEFIDVYYNEDMEKPEYESVWDEIHAKLADYGFILRYLEGEEHITGYRYEPWHIRYVDDVDIAREIMSQPGLTLEEYLAGESAPEVEIDLGSSDLYTEDELYDAMLAVKCQFASWAGCELHAIRYAGDEANNEENLAWLDSLADGAGYTQVAEFLMDFHTGTYAGVAWEPDTEYTDYQWWLARGADGDWAIVSFGY